MACRGDAAHARWLRSRDRVGEPAEVGYRRHVRAAAGVGARREGGLTVRVFVALAALALVLSGAVAGTAQAASPDVVISEFGFRGPDGAADELIELYNRSTAPVPIGGLLIRGSNNAGTVSMCATITANTILGAGCHYLVTGATYSGAAPGDETFSTGVTDDGGIAITTGDQATIIDAVGLVDRIGLQGRNTLASLGAANTNHSYERKPGGGSGSGVDTDDNSADFEAITPSDAQNLLSTCIGSTTPTGPTGSGAATPTRSRPAARRA